jgi:hypothetical protein
VCGGYLCALMKILFEENEKMLEENEENIKKKIK